MQLQKVILLLTLGKPDFDNALLNQYLTAYFQPQPQNLLVLLLLGRTYLQVMHRPMVPVLRTYNGYALQMA